MTLSPSAYVYRPKNRPDVVYLSIGSGGYRTLIDHPDFGRGSNLLADQRLLAEVAAEEAAGGHKSLRMMLVDDLLAEALQAA